MHYNATVNNFDVTWLSPSAAFEKRH